MAQLYLLHEICTNKTLRVQMETYDTNNNFERHTREEKQKYHQNNVIQTQMHSWIQFLFCAHCSVMTTDALLYNAIQWRFCSAYYFFFSIVEYCIIDCARCVYLLIFIFILSILMKEHSRKKPKKLISMTHILSVEILSYRILFFLYRMARLNSITRCVWNWLWFRTPNIIYYIHAFWAFTNFRMQ